MKSLSQLQVCTNRNSDGRGSKYSNTLAADSALVVVL